MIVISAEAAGGENIRGSGAGSENVRIIFAMLYKILAY